MLVIITSISACTVMVLKFFILSDTKFKQVSFYARVIFLKNVAKIRHRTPIYNSAFPGELGD
jgi:hypothetical protein